jgi:outer membrane lipopolysaccharide assembly protein LptE/RlpB
MKKRSMKKILLTIAILATTATVTAQTFSLNNKGTLRWKVTTQCESVAKCMAVYVSAKSKGLNASVKMGKRSNKVTVEYKAQCDNACLANPVAYIASL